MFCSSCGAKVADTARFCPICGAALAAPDVPSAAPSTSAPGASPAPDAGFAAPAQPAVQAPASPAAAAPGQGFAPQAPAQQAPAQQQPVAGAPYPAVAAEPPMKWYKFVIWVQLFLSALSFAVTTFQLAQGAFTLVSDIFPSLAAAYGYVPGEWVLFTVFNVVFAVLFCALAVMCIVVRQELAAFRRVGPTHYYVLLGAAVGVQLLLIVIRSLLMSVFAADAAVLTSMVVAVAMIFINKAYFDKRMHLFVN